MATCAIGRCGGEWPAITKKLCLSEQLPLVHSVGCRLASSSQVILQCIWCVHSRCSLQHTGGAHTWPLCTPGIAGVHDTAHSRTGSPPAFRNVGGVSEGGLCCFCSVWSSPQGYPVGPHGAAASMEVGPEQCRHEMVPIPNVCPVLAAKAICRCTWVCSGPLDAAAMQVRRLPKAATSHSQDCVTLQRPISWIHGACPRAASSTFSPSQ